MLRGLRATASDATYAGADFENLIFCFDGTKLSVTDSASGVDVADHDAIMLIGWFKSKMLDDTARAVAHYAHSKGVPFVNSEAYHGRSFTKLSQCVIAALNGVNVTPFLFAIDKQVLLRAVASSRPTFPRILKAVAASRGQDNYLVHSYDEIAALLAEASDPPKNFILQEFVPNEGDFRLIVMGGTVRLAIHRKAPLDSHLNNTSQGGVARLVEPAELPEKVIADSILLAKLLRREVTGVDMIQHRDTGQYYFLEANNMPQLSTGSFVPEKMKIVAGYLAELAEKTTTVDIDQTD